MPYLREDSYDFDPWYYTNEDDYLDLLEEMAFNKKLPNLDADRLSDFLEDIANSLAKLIQNNIDNDPGYALCLRMAYKFLHNLMWEREHDTK